MKQQTLDVRAPSGARVRLEWSDDAALTSRVMGIRFAGSNYGRGFQIGARGHHDHATRYLVPATLRERLVVGRREVLVSAAHDNSATIATLLGEHHELMTVFAGPAPSRAALLDLFGVLDIDDQPEGMRVTPRAATLLTVVNEHVVAVIDQRGSIGVPGLAQAKALLPKWRGAKTAHGEVWRAPLPGVPDQRAALRARDYSYVLGYPRGVAEVHLEPEGPLSDDDLLRWMDTIRVSWLDGKARAER